MVSDRPVYFEIRRVGSYLKVSAIDSLTGTEVSVVGPARGSDAQLKATALKKLRYVLEKQGPSPRR